jgi:hypothetical protein
MSPALTPRSAHPLDFWRFGKRSLVDGFLTSWESVKVIHPAQIASGEHVIFMIFPQQQRKDLPYRVPSIWD